MQQAFHILICSAWFDRKAEGICTGRLVRGLLDAGAEVTLITSSKADLSLRHPKLSAQSFAVQPRDPKPLFRAWSRLTDGLDCNIYMWSRRAANCELPTRPDVVYARAWPDASLMAGYRIAEKHDLPLWIHLSDPFPTPGDEDMPAYRRADLQRVADRALGCTFTNEETIGYQREHLQFPHDDWAQVLRHVAPTPKHLAPRPRRHRFYYIGTLNWKRNPEMLLKAFGLYRQKHPEATLTVAGPHHEPVKEKARALGVLDGIRFDRYRSDNREHMAEADVLVAIDNQVGPQLYTTTKIVEYLCVDRPLLHLARADGPDRAMTNQFSSCVPLDPQSPEEICAGMEKAYALDGSSALFEDRFESMRKFSGPAIGQQLISMIRQSQPASASSE